MNQGNEYPEQQVEAPLLQQEKVQQFPQQPQSPVKIERQGQQQQQIPQNNQNNDQQDPQSPSYSSSSKSNEPPHQDNLHSPKQQQLQGSPKPKQQQTNPNQIQKTRYKYCCKVCKHTGQGKRACVCVVPLNERRTIIGEQGCQTCRCKGCSIEDFISRGEDPVYRVVKINKQDLFDPKKMCCKKCMRAFYNNGKPCFCQYPPKQRKGKLKANGCSLCGCSGCNTDDYKQKPKEKERQKKRVSKSRSREKRRKNRRSRSRSSSSKSSKRSSSPEIVDVKAMNFNNFDRSFLGSMILNDFRVFPGLMGFGIPQRTQSYIMNHPKK